MRDQATSGDAVGGAGTEVIVRVRVDNGGPPQGTVRSTERDEPVPFSGWLELMALVDRLRTRQSPA